MTMQKTCLASTIMALSLGVISQAHAQGFALNEQSVSALGAANAGRTALITDASTVFSNPAGMSRIKHIEVSNNALYIDVNNDFSNTTATYAGQPVTGIQDSNIVPKTWIGAGYAVLPYTDGLTFGVGLYAPFGGKTNYDQDFQGRLFGDKSTTKVITLQPTVAYAINPELSVGLGLTVNRFESILSAATSPDNPAAGDFSVDTRTFTNTGDDIAAGFNLGVLYSPMPDLNLGLSYRSKVDYTAKGTARIQNAITATGPTNASASSTLEVTLPAMMELGMSYALQPDITLLGTIQRTQWSQFNDQFPTSSLPAPYNRVGEEQDYDDVNMYSIGVNYQYMPNLVLRAGLGFDESPLDVSSRTVRVPVADRTIFTIGAGYDINQDTSVDVSAQYLTEKDGDINRTRSYATPLGSIPATYSSTVSNSGYILGVQVNHRF